MNTHRLPTLRAFLDAGHDVTTIDGWDFLAETVALLCLHDDEHRHRVSRANRLEVEKWLAADGEVVEHGVVTALWEAECCDDPALAARFLDALPADVRVDLAEVAEVIALEQAVYGGDEPPVEWPDDNELADIVAAIRLEQAVYGDEGPPIEWPATGDR